jgi:hypothetical protein
MFTNTVMNRSMIDGSSTKSKKRSRIRRQKRRVERPLAGLSLAPAQEEVLVIDDRAHLRPAQIVERKLTRMLQEASVPVSHLQMRGLLKAR